MIGDERLWPICDWLLEADPSRLSGWGSFVSLLSQRLVLAEPRAKFSGNDERLNHFRAAEVAKLVQFVQPKVITVEVLVRHIVRVATQVTVILHQHERRVISLTDKGLTFDDLAQGRGAPSPCLSFD